MLYKDTLEYLMNIPRFSKSLSLERIKFLLSAFGNPQNSLKAVHIAGTNGKGSTTTMVSRILMSAGYRVGTYISPFVEDFKERICVDGEFIQKDALCLLAEQVRDISSGMEDYPNAFEQITAIALKYFHDCGCHIVCLEAGLGGRWDATNIIPPPLAAVITSIGLDHVQFLGDTHEKIALEKCGIIKHGSSAVVSPLQPAGVIDVVRADCDEKGVICTVPDTGALSVREVSHYGSEFEYKSLPLRVGLPGEHQVYNAITAVEAALTLRDKGFDISDSDIIAGLQAASLPARMEIVSRKPLCIVDGAHNPPGIHALASAIDSVVGGQRLVTIFGCLEDKGAEEMTREIAEKSSSFICVLPDSPKANPLDKIKSLAAPFCSDIYTCDDYKEAVEKALSLAGDDGAVLVCGSLYLAGPMKRELERQI